MAWVGMRSRWIAPEPKAESLQPPHMRQLQAFICFDGPVNALSPSLSNTGLTRPGIVEGPAAIDSPAIPAHRSCKREPGSPLSIVPYPPAYG